MYYQDEIIQHVKPDDIKALNTQCFMVLCEEAWNVMPHFSWLKLIFFPLVFDNLVTVCLVRVICPPPPPPKAFCLWSNNPSQTCQCYCLKVYLKFYSFSVKSTTHMSLTLFYWLVYFVTVCRFARVCLKKFNFPEKWNSNRTYMLKRLI